MSEYPGSHNVEPDVEITDDQKRTLIARARAFAPFRGQPVDVFGSYVTHFNHQDEDGFTSIYIPGLSGTVNEGDLFSDNIQIVKRVPEFVDDWRAIMHITSYGIHETSMVTEYITDIRFFNVETGEEIRTPKTQVERIEASIEEYHTRMEPITTSLLVDLNRLLDSLDPNDTRDV
jgi:hypothetical protein